MIGMQYKVILPNDYDMGIIRKRVEDNGHKTDGFPGLKVKFYLLSEANKDNNLYNSYAPLYLWDNSKGMNDFVFGGFYDNIIKSFGWQHINIGVPLTMNLGPDFDKSRYVVEYCGNISENNTLINTHFENVNDYVANADKSLGDFIVYNPDKWGYSQFSFYREKPIIDSLKQLTIYELLHVSQ